ncbi:MAG: amino acid racemase [Methanomassiliicoccaceae archaeon]|nr:amino acid racemase [Methanomassiliicoccaceae archaeon]
MKRVGIIGGVGPASTLDYYTGIIDGYRAKNGGDSYPEIVINSIRMDEVSSLVQNKDWDALTDKLVSAVNDLANAGADFAAITANTLHIVFNEVEKRSPIPLISIVDETCKRAGSEGCRKVLVIGTLFTMQNDLYQKAFGKYGIKAVVPPKKEQEEIHGLFFPNLENGIVVPDDKRKVLEIVEKLIKEQNADALVLGCTELPLMIKEGDVDVLILNTTEIHIGSIVDSI